MGRGIDAMKQQYSMMKIDPATGAKRPYPSHARQWREYHGRVAWVYDPWQNPRELPSLRRAEDIGSDPFGVLILPSGESLYA